MVTTKVKAQEKQLLRIVNEKVEKNESNGVKMAQRLTDLCLKIKDSYSKTYIDDELGADPYCIDRWIKQEHVPLRNSLLGISRLLRVSENSFDAYYRKGEITLDELWTRRGENVKQFAAQQLTPESFKACLELFDENDRKAALWLIFPEMVDMLNQLKNPPAPVAIEPEEEKIHLEPQATKRLHNLYSMSKLVLGFDPNQLDEGGVGTDLVLFYEDFKEETTSIDFPKSAYEPLLKFLFKVYTWGISQHPSGMDTTKRFETVDELIECLNV